MWIKKRSVQESLDILESLSEVAYLTACQRGACDHKLDEVISLVRCHDYSALSTRKVDFAGYSEATESATHSIVGQTQILAFYQKLDFLDLGVDRGLAAMEKWVESERNCLFTNRLLGYARRKPAYLPESAHVVLHYAMRKISRILGPVPDVNNLQFAFGPGATTTTKARCACPRVKLSSRLGCSPELSSSLSDLLGEVPAWLEIHDISDDPDKWVVEVVPQPGKMTLVPKNSRVDRPIMIEPILNSFFQKGIGSFLRDRLARVGVDLNDQSVNQQHALIGSVLGDRATIDLSSASDSISCELVRELLPDDWFQLLSAMRTGSCYLPKGFEVDVPSQYKSTYKGAWELQKFSSMGNGFTFELESLIFYAIALGVCNSLHLSTRLVSVYGDDIIVPTAAFSRFKEVIQLLGFSINSEKSFSTGFFRESCGSDYFFGYSVRPFSFKTRLSDRTLYTAHNWFIRNGERELASACESAIIGEKLYGPDGFGDGHLIGSHQLRTNRKTLRDGWCGGYFDTFSLKPVRYSALQKGDAALPVYSVYTRSGACDPTDPDVVRGSRGYRKTSIYTLTQGIF